MTTKPSALAEVCRVLESDGTARAARVLRETCVPGKVLVPSGGGMQKAARRPGRQSRCYSKTQKTQLFLRDGFLDRYSGEQLVFPGALLLLSHLFPTDFPYDPHWPYDVCHSWYWEVYPTVDHVDSVGDDVESNWVTTSMIRNVAKASASLEERGWTLMAEDQAARWDGLIHWFVRYMGAHPELKAQKALREWFTSAQRALGGAEPLLSPEVPRRP